LRLLRGGGKFADVDFGYFYYARKGGDAGRSGEKSCCRKEEGEDTREKKEGPLGE